jgi:ubiquinone/menaquinone biosynthesis C-methylase UbiE
MNFMKKNNQKNAFLNYEANEWFNRNKETLKNYDGSNDLVVDLLEKYNTNFKNVLEIGCSFGYRLNHLKKKYNQCSVFGIDPSSQAIEFGKKEYPNINLHEGTADKMNNYKTNFFDVVIVGFVFYVLDRDDLLKVVSEIDRVLNNGGTLIIVDFFALKPHKNPYEHIKNFNAYSFKQSYEEVFLASKIYSLFDKITVNHQDHSMDLVDNYSEKMTYTLLKRDVVANYG